MNNKETLYTIKQMVADGALGQETAEKYFPELAESEYERIRKQIKAFIKSRGSQITQSKTDTWIAWLEKLGEQKSAEKVQLKFKAGDWIVFNGFTLLVNEVVQGYYRTIAIDGIRNSYDWDIDNAARLWTIQDAKDGDVLVASDGSIFLFKGTVDCACRHYIALTTDHVVKFNKGLVHYWETSRAVHPATKEQRDLLLQKMHEAGYEWNAEKKELKKIEQKYTPKHRVGDTIYYNSFGELKSMVVANVVTDSTDNPMYEDKEGNAVFEKALIEQKPAWSEEDEKMQKEAIRIVERPGSIFQGTNLTKKVADWLKSLKDRILPLQKQEWSEKDKALLDGAIHIARETGNINIMNWLKSLKDRILPQPKQEWSEEDEMIYQHCLTILYDYGYDEWLKSLCLQKQSCFIASEAELATAKKDAFNEALDKIEYSSGEPSFEDGWCAALKYVRQKQWKPSEKQLEVIDMVLTNEAMDDNIARILHELKEQLKKL